MNNKTFMAALMLPIMGVELPKSSPTLQKTDRLSASIAQDKIPNYYKYISDTFESTNYIRKIKNCIKADLELSDSVKHKVIELIDFFSVNDIELPDVSPTDDKTVIFEFSDSNLHYGVEIFNSDLISYFTNKSGEYVHDNFKSMDKIKSTLLGDTRILHPQM